MVSRGEGAAFLTLTGEGSPEGVVFASPPTVYVDEGSGDCWTKASGSEATGWVPVGGGGSGQTDRELFGGGSQTFVPGDGSNVFLPWTKTGGNDLLDLTDPTLPTVLTAGIYAFNITVIGETSADPTELMWVGLDVDANGDDAFQDQWFPLAVDGAIALPEGALSLVYYCPAGAVVEAAVRTNKAAGIEAALQASVQRIT